VANADVSLLLTGQGDVVQPTDGVIGIGSGGSFAAAAAKALVKHSNLSARQIVEESLRIAASIDVYTNDTLIVEELPCGK
jgi:ATP-dependent HslUV protease subunit HslV